MSRLYIAAAAAIWRAGLRVQDRRRQLPHGRGGAELGGQPAATLAASIAVALASASATTASMPTCTPENSLATRSYDDRADRWTEYRWCSAGGHE